MNKQPYIVPHSAEEIDMCDYECNENGGCPECTDYNIGYYFGFDGQMLSVDVFFEINGRVING